MNDSLLCWDKTNRTQNLISPLRDFSMHKRNNFLKSFPLLLLVYPFAFLCHFLCVFLCLFVCVFLCLLVCVFLCLFVCVCFLSRCLCLCATVWMLSPCRVVFLFDGQFVMNLRFILLICMHSGRKPPKYCTTTVFDTVPLTCDMLRLVIMKS